jgi:hypothetical protein
MWLTCHDTCDSWIPRGRICLPLQDLARWTGIHEEMISSDLHEGFVNFELDFKLLICSLNYDCT